MAISNSAKRFIVATIGASIGCYMGFRFLRANHVVLIRKTEKTPQRDANGNVIHKPLKVYTRGAAEMMDDSSKEE